MKISNFILPLLLLLTFAGCTVRPRNVLSSSEMREILIDLHKAEGVIKVSGLNYGHETEEMSYYLDVLEKHGITQAQFDSSIVWYTDNPRFFDKIYPKVVATLQQELKEYDYLDAKTDDAQTNKPTLRPIDEWLEEAQHGLPLQYEPENLHYDIDTTFIYIII